VAEIARRKTAVVIYTSHADESIVAEALDAGVRAVVLKDDSPDNLLAALGSVAAGEIYVDPQIARDGHEESS
jgi:DNA-binding NarL/FixJ family response regulator